MTTEAKPAPKGKATGSMYPLTYKDSIQHKAFDNVSIFSSQNKTQTNSLCLYISKMSLIIMQ